MSDALKTRGQGHQLINNLLFSCLKAHFFSRGFDMKAHSLFFLAAIFFKPILAMETPRIIAWFDQFEVKHYLTSLKDADDQIVTIEFSDSKNHSEKIAMSKLRAIVPIVYTMIQDCQNHTESPIPLKYSKMAFLVAVAAHYLKHEMGISLTKVDLLDAIASFEERAQLLSELHALDSSAGVELISKNGLLEPHVVEQQLELLQSHSDKLLLEWQQKQSMNISNMTTPQITLFKHLIQTKPDSESNKILLKSIFTKKLEMLLPYPTKISTREILIKYPAVRDKVLTILRELYSYQLKYPVATHFIYQITLNRRNIAFNNKRFEAKRKYDGQTQQCAYELNNIIISITDCLNALELHPNFSFDNSLNIKIRL